MEKKKVRRREKRGKTARLFAPTCLDLKERGAKTKTQRRLGRLEKGNTKGENGRKRRRGRGRGADTCAAPKGLSAFEAKAQEQAVASTSQRSVCG